jgi:hypothetical protein
VGHWSQSIFFLGGFYDSNTEMRNCSRFLLSLSLQFDFVAFGISLITEIRLLLIWNSKKSVCVSAKKFLKWIPHFLLLSFRLGNQPRFLRHLSFRKLSKSKFNWFNEVRNNSRINFSHSVFRSINWRYKEIRVFFFLWIYFNSVIRNVFRCPCQIFALLIKVQVAKATHANLSNHEIRLKDLNR